jgi:hypothetical protein
MSKKGMAAVIRKKMPDAAVNLPEDFLINLLHR